MEPSFKQIWRGSNYSFSYSTDKTNWSSSKFRNGGGSVMNIQPELKQDSVKAWSISRENCLDDWQLTIIVCVSVVGVLTIFILVMCVLKRLLRSNGESSKQWIFHQVVKPPVEEYNVVQPQGGVVAINPAGNQEVVLEKEEKEPLSTERPWPEPIRIKAKGLLERRGSNASLKIDLQPTPETLSMPTPPRECTAEEYLLSAGNRLSRKQLRLCLKDVKALHAEFWEVPLNHPERTEIAGSGTKNRYRTIIANEHSRVHLKEKSGDPLSGYINANYVRGFDGEDKVYIATQGPLLHTITDFWQMVFYQNSPVIVMITKLKENGQTKCESYLPEFRGTYGDVVVTVNKVAVRDGYTIRELDLACGEERRVVLHYWFTAWPDHKTPSSAKSLVAMAMEVEESRHENNGKNKGPVVIHCSAGIGRTGCFIAISLGMIQMLEENNVDVLGIMCAMRCDRGGMIQTAEQYEFVHRALLLFERTLPDYSGD